MTSDAHDPLKWPAAYPVSSAGDDRFSLLAILAPFIALTVIICMIFSTNIFGEGRGAPDKPIVVTGASAESPPPHVAAPPEPYPSDMNTLGPEFGAWILKKHPEMSDQVEKLQQHLQTLCASINAICSHQETRFDPAGTCKNRPPQCAP